MTFSVADIIWCNNLIFDNKKHPRSSSFGLSLLGEMIGFKALIPVNDLEIFPGVVNGQPWLTCEASFFYFHLSPSVHYPCDVQAHHLSFETSSRKSSFLVVRHFQVPKHQQSPHFPNY